MSRQTASGRGFEQEFDLPNPGVLSSVPNIPCEEKIGLDALPGPDFPAHCRGAEPVRGRGG